MKQIVYFLLLIAALYTPVLAQTRIDATMTVDSVEREFIVVRPSGAVPPGGYPVVFMFHGTSGDGERFYNISGWKEKGEAEKFITVFPSSLAYCFLNDSGRQVPTTKWANGDAEEKKCPGVVLKDDVRFVRRMVDTITATLPVDRTRFYAAGFSNGGVFVSKLAVEMSDVFAAVAPAAAMLHPLDTATPLRNIPIAYLIGDHDRNALEAAGIDAVPFNDSCMLVFGGIVRLYLQTFNLAESFTKDSTALSLTYLSTTPRSASPPSTLFSFTLLKGLTHEYPNGSNYPIAAATYLWPFFNRYRSAAVPDESDAAAMPMEVYPNPAAGYVMVRGDGRMTVTLSTMLGERVLTATAARESRIDLGELTPGVYIVEISDGTRRAARLITVR